MASGRIGGVIWVCTVYGVTMTLPHNLSSLHYPNAQRLDLVENLPAPAGPVSVADPYRWLEDASSEQSQAWQKAQDELYAAHRAEYGTGQVLRERLGDLAGVGFIGPPTWRGDRCFFMRRSGDQEHAVLVVAEGDSERVLLDPMELNPDGTTTLDTWQPSKEGDLLAYQVSEGGREESVLYVLDVASGDVVDGPIDRARYSSVSWLPGGESFFFVRRLAPEGLPDDEQQYHRRVYWHTVGQPTSSDVEVFGAGQNILNYYFSSVSMDGQWLVVSSSLGTDPRTDVRLARLTNTTPHVPEFVDVIVGEDAQTSAHVDTAGRLMVHTDLDAPRRRLVIADPHNPHFSTWRTVIAERPDAVLSDWALITSPSAPGGEEILVAWTHHAVGQITRHNVQTGQKIGHITLPGVGTIGGLVTRPIPDTSVWFTYTDFVTNPRVLHYDATNETVEIHADPPGVVDFCPITSQHIAYTSKDGTEVHMFVVSRTDMLTENGTPTTPAPTVLYGYGGFGASMTPGFSPGILAWVEAGGRYAIACLRGGGEEGETWHRDGMLGAKQNVFDDFLAAADTLVHHGHTTPAQLAISGGSNGGLLVGAAVTQAPEKFSAVVCSAPLLDMVRYQLHGLGATWAGEYGDAQLAEDLTWLHAYSPYHNVHDRVAYPATLFEVFEGDTRVDPLHARKLCAAMQHATANPLTENPILIRLEHNVGHGARALSRSLDMVAESLLFMGHHTGWSAPQ